jgi:hypothetical protein
MADRGRHGCASDSWYVEEALEATPDFDHLLTKRPQRRHEEADEFDILSS